MSVFLLKEVSPVHIQSELEQIGFDTCYINKACDKFRYKNIKVFGLTPAQANILKQTALIFGADCGVNRNVITGNVEFSDAILCGSISQLKKIAAKLKNQPFKLGILGENINALLLSNTRKTKLAGILNITPDSFSDGGKYLNPNDSIKQLCKLIEEGADMIDIGAESTRPYSHVVAPEEQIKRLKPVLDFINQENLQITISIDTRSSIVADFVLNQGVAIINDVSGFDFDSKLPEIIAKHNAGVIIQHSKGTPDIMQDAPNYKNVIDEIFLNLKIKIDYAKEKGINSIIIDPGIGFGKTRDDNFEILNRIEEFYSLNCPVMVGISRKSLLGVTNNDNELKDSISAALAYPLIQKGVDYLRVHNVHLHKKLLEFV